MSSAVALSVAESLDVEVSSRYRTTSVPAPPLTETSEARLAKLPPPMLNVSFPPLPWTATAVAGPDPVMEIESAPEPALRLTALAPEKLTGRIPLNCDALSCKLRAVVSDWSLKLTVPPTPLSKRLIVPDSCVSRPLPTLISAT